MYVGCLLRRMAYVCGLSFKSETTVIDFNVMATY